MLKEKLQVFHNTLEILHLVFQVILKQKNGIELGKNYISIRCFLILLRIHFQAFNFCKLIGFTNVVFA